MSTMQGINFNGVDSSSFAGLECYPQIPLLPEKRRSTMEVFGRDGLWDFNVNSYSPRIIPVNFKAKAANRDALRTLLNQVAAWLSGSGYLILNYDPDVRFQAKVYANTDINKYEAFGLFPAQFECNPPWAEDVAATTGTVGTAQDYGSLIEFSPVITVSMTGGASYVQVTHVASGKFVRFTDTLANGNTLIFDMGFAKVSKNGVIQMLKVSIDSLFFNVPPGSQQINVTTDGTCAVSMSYRRRYPYA